MSVPPFISIVTICRNSLVDIERTWNSLPPSSDDQDIEWIVVDGASTDGTVDFLKNCDDPRLSWESEVDDGIYDAMNKGIRRANGRYILLLNAGDELISENWSQTIEYVKSAPESELFYFSSLYVFGANITILRPVHDDGTYIYHGMPSNHQSIVFAKDVFAISMFDQGYKVCGDYAHLSALFMSGVDARCFRHAATKFHSGGTSSRNFVTLFYEPMKVQREILGLGVWPIFRSFMHRLVSTVLFQGVIFASYCGVRIGGHLKRP